MHMKMALLATAACGAAIVVALAAQNREPDFAGPPSRLAAALDADHDCAISAAEIRASPASLKALDVNGDGRVEGEELRPDFGRGGPRGDGPPGFGGRRGRGDGGEGRGEASQASADELADTLMAFDRNGDGTLVRAEVPERFQGLFDRADANKDGSLSRDELKQSATASAPQDDGRGRRGGREGGREGFGRGRGGPMGDPLMRALDADRDGVLSESELARAADALRTLDANRDGQLSSDEFRPAPGGPGGRDGRGR